MGAMVEIGGDGGRVVAQEWNRDRNSVTLAKTITMTLIRGPRIYIYIYE